MNIFITGFLRANGASEPQIALIEKELPDLENLIATFRSHQAQLDRVLQLLEVVQTIVHNQRSDLS